MRELSPWEEDAIRTAREFLDRPGVKEFFETTQRHPGLVEVMEAAAGQGALLDRVHEDVDWMQRNLPVAEATQSLMRQTVFGLHYDRSIQGLLDSWNQIEDGPFGAAHRLLDQRPEVWELSRLVGLESPLTSLSRDLKDFWDVHSRFPHPGEFQHSDALHELMSSIGSGRMNAALDAVASAAGVARGFSHSFIEDLISGEPVAESVAARVFAFAISVYNKFAHHAGVVALLLAILIPLLQSMQDSRREREEELRDAKQDEKIEEGNERNRQLMEEFFIDAHKQFQKLQAGIDELRRADRYIVIRDVKLRGSESLDGDVLAKIESGSEVVFLELSKGWVRVEYMDTSTVLEGWLPSDSIEKVEGQPD